MAAYYYLISSLPDLKSDGEMPLSYKEFLDLCESQVSPDKFRLLKELTLSSTEGPLVNEWNRVYGSLTKELNYQRSMKLGKTYPNPADKEFTTVQVVSSALAAKDPLEAEKIMLDYEFQQLDELVGLHMFDDYVLFGYAVKLKLLERQGCFDHDKGKSEFRQLLGEVQQRVYTL
ncbi:DUF2764 family protein [Oribacterium sp. WCC10]|uniref:DUF2764 family protein n=1 Tax=Oribacterium sp. WCC10 TaxID=1855343 RepID=UPI0008E5C89E|nr:DUF2764 family protein [Oribacterium sp. WCC10]SFG47970.1 Protein of unknown function [Oribacterium sp. WCC10]